MMMRRKALRICHSKLVIYVVWTCLCEQKGGLHVILLGIKKSKEKI